jgi:hypothetical protein
MNKKLISRIVLTILLLSVILMLSSCSVLDGELGLGLFQMLGSFIMIVLGIIVSIFSAIISVIMGIILFIVGLFTTIGGLIATVLSLFAGLF